MPPQMKNISWETIKELMDTYKVHILAFYSATVSHLSPHLVHPLLS